MSTLDIPQMSTSRSDESYPKQQTNMKKKKITDKIADINPAILDILGQYYQLSSCPVFASKHKTIDQR